MHNLTFFEATRTIKQREGASGFYRGFTPSVLKSMCSAGIYFFSLNALKTGVFTSLFDSENMVNMWSSAVARLIQTILTNPIILIKTRFEVVGFNEYTSILDAVRKIYRYEGLVGFMNGVQIAIIRDIPFSGIFYPIYEIIKKSLSVILATQENDFQRLMAISMVSAFGANFVGCLCTHPLDIIRTRMLFQHYNKDSIHHYDGLIDGLQKVYRYEGVIGFYRGLTPRLMRKGLGNIIAWSAYEYLTNRRLDLS